MRELSAAQRAEIGAAISSIKGDRTTLLSSARGSFLSERAALIQRQATDKDQLKSAWRRHGEERKRAFEASRGFAQSKQAAQAEKGAERGAEGARERKEFKSASQKRKPRASGRSRKRTRRQE